MLFCLLSKSTTWAQDETHRIRIAIPEVALLAVRSANSTAVHLQGTVATEAGVAVEFTDKNSDMWINYSSIVGMVSEPSRSISVQLTEGKVPDGLKLSVVAGSDVGQGIGDLGIPVKNELRVTERSKVIIKAIGSSYTGKGVRKGHNLTYSFALLNEKKAYSEMNFNASTPLVVTYTLSDN
ncbi:MAG: hypothetical protein COB60_10120 [Flavobacteriaceae bacterium]|nr:MAG: hypothetical protein COB60_10120 [Flavobacteriaceae bacterium]